MSVKIYSKLLLITLICLIVGYLLYLLAYSTDNLKKSVQFNRFVQTRKNSTNDKYAGGYNNYSGIQMGDIQIKAIVEALQENGNLLVWGLGNDSPYWHTSTSGKVIFIEDDIPAAKAGILWFDTIITKYPFLEVYQVHYTTENVKSFEKYAKNTEIWYELDLSDQLPTSVTKTHWHVIIIDAPLGCCQLGPGRYQSIYTSWILARDGTHIFVDDFERKIEHYFSMSIFGIPLGVIRRNRTENSLQNEQAHFLFSSNRN